VKKLIFIFILFYFSEKAFCQYSFTGSASGTMDISSIVNLTVSTPGTITFSTTSDYLNGITSLNYTSLAVKSNILWLVEVQANAANFTAMGGGASSSMPCTVLSYRVNGTSAFTTMSTGAQTLQLGDQGDASSSGNTFGLDLKFNPGFSYPGGQYSISLLYTITNQ